MGVRIHVVGLPVGGPAGVPDADGPFHGPSLVHQGAEHLQPALGLLDLQTLLRREHRDACRVVAPILQPLQPVQQDGAGLGLAHVTYDTAHMDNTPYFVIVYLVYVRDIIAQYAQKDKRRKGAVL